ncbi:MAG: hypothetical protein AB7T10_06830 [bacterium]
MRSQYLYINYRYVIVVVIILYFSISLTASEGGYVMTGMGRGTEGLVNGGLARVYWMGISEMKSNVGLLNEMCGTEAGIGINMNKFVGGNSYIAYGKGIKRDEGRYGIGIMVNRLDVLGRAFTVMDDTTNGMGYSGFVERGDNKFSITELNIGISGDYGKLDYGVLLKGDYGKGESTDYWSYGGDLGIRYLISENIGEDIDSMGISLTGKDILGHKIEWGDGIKEKSNTILDVGIGCKVNIEKELLKGFSTGLRIELGGKGEIGAGNDIRAKAGLTLEMKNEMGLGLKLLTGYDGHNLRGGIRIDAGSVTIGYMTGYMLGSLESLMNTNTSVELTKKF